jgi:hypothetical protein
MAVAFTAAASVAAVGAARGFPQVQSAWDLGSPLLLTPTAAMATATPTMGTIATLMADAIRFVSGRRGDLA